MTVPREKEQFTLVMRWQAVLEQCAQALMQAQDLPAVVREMARAVNYVFPNTGMLVALGELREPGLAHAIADPAALTSDQAVYLFSRPYLDDALEKELAHLLFAAAKRLPPHGKRWWLMRECAPQLQYHLETRFQLPGQGLLVPLRWHDEVYGIILLAHATLFQDVQDARECGVCALMLADMFTVWLRYHAPRLLGIAPGNMPAPIPLPGQAALSALDHIIPPLQALAAGVQVMETLEAVASTALPTTTETLCLNVGALLHHIGQTDVVLALTNEGEQGFVAACALSGPRLWARRQPQTPPDFPFDAAQLQAPWPDRFVAHLRAEKQPMHLRDASEVQRHAHALAQLNQRSVLILPVLVHDRVTAIFVLGREQEGGFSDLLLSAACTIATLAGAIWHAHQATQERDAALAASDRVWHIASSVISQMLTVLQNIATSHGVLTANHPQQIADLAGELALAQHLTPLEVFHIRVAALLCDLGMISIPTSILQSDRELTPSERLLIREHPRTSVQLLQDLTIFKDAWPIILHHHERWDGSGYPDQLVATAIPVGARILAVADAYISMQAERLYRPSYTAQAALQHIIQQAGAHFDPNVVHTLERVIAAKAYRPDGPPEKPGEEIPADAKERPSTAR
jgi:HD-GYP domain-containing protein (c-di-GMP phosphodiesterase class II)